MVSEAPGDLPPSHGGGQSAGTDSTDSKETAEPPEGRRTWLGLGLRLGVGLGLGLGVRVRVRVEVGVRVRVGVGVRG